MCIQLIFEIFWSKINNEIILFQAWGRSPGKGTSCQGENGAWKNRERTERKRGAGEGEEREGETRTGGEGASAVPGGPAFQQDFPPGPAQGNS